MKKNASFAAQGALVYSTDGGRHCPGCKEPINDCTCNREGALLGDGHVRVSRESKGRGGKTVTVISGLPLTAAQLKESAKQLKQACGVGGAVKGGMIEIQGDQQEKVLQWLAAQGYKAKRSGG